MRIIKKAVLLSVMLFIVLTLKAQQENSKVTEWTEVYTDNAVPTPHKVEIAFKFSTKCSVTSFYRTPLSEVCNFGLLCLYIVSTVNYKAALRQ